MDKGASLRDRAVVNGAGQAVSALRASVPSAALFLLSERVAAGGVKALSIKQPWPHRIFHEGKDVENRDWPTRGRGWIIIHAGKTYDGGRPPAAHADLPFGGIVGMARITDCVEHMDSEWFFGRYGFVLANAFPVDLIPVRGQLGFFVPPHEALTELAEAILAQAIEARRAETLGSVHESAVAESHAPEPTPTSETNHG